MSLHQEARRHPVAGREPAPDLAITRDDATSVINSAVLIEQAGTASSFRGLAEVIERHGRFIELDTDRAQRARSDPAGTVARGGGGGQPLLPHAASRREGLQDPFDPLAGLGLRAGAA